MIYKISRDSEARIAMEYGNGEEFENKRVIIYVDTYFTGNRLIEKFEADNYGVVCKFIIEENVNEEDREDYDSDDEYQENVLSEYMYVLERYVVSSDVDNISLNELGDVFSFSG